MAQRSGNGAAWCSLREAAAILARSPSAVYRLALFGSVRARRDSVGRVEYHRADLERARRDNDGAQLHPVAAAG